MIATGTFQEFFRWGFYFSFVAWIVAFLLIGRFYIMAAIRKRRITAFVGNAIVVGSLATAESGYYAYLLTFDQRNVLARQIAALGIAYSLGIAALIYIVTGAIITRDIWLDWLRRDGNG